MNVLVTGAFGRVGTALLDELGDRDAYSFTCLDDGTHPEYEDHTTIVADMTDYEAIRPAFRGQDAVIHLAYARSPAVAAENREITWSTALDANLQGTTNVVAAAVDADVEQFVYASSNHVVGMYEVEHGPEIYERGYDVFLDHEAQPRPDSLYGVSKLYGEGICRLAADVHGLQCYVLRLGAIRSRDEDHPFADAERGVSEGNWERGGEAYTEQVTRLKALWQSRRDCAHLVECCLSDERVSYDVFYGVSDNARRWLDIEHARDVLGYDPEARGEAWNAPP